MKFKQILAALALATLAFTGCEKANIDVDTTPTGWFGNW
jgi:hypothetical protein